MSKYDRNPWLDDGTEECKDLVIASAKWFQNTKFPVLVDVAAEAISKEMKTYDMLLSAAQYGDPKSTIGRHLSRFYDIRGRQLRRNGVRSRFYVIHNPAKVLRNLGLMLMQHGIDSDEELQALVPGFSL